MQNPNFVLPLAFSKIVYKPGSTKRSSHPDDTRVCAPACACVACRCGCTGSDWELVLQLSAAHTSPSTLILEKYSYYTHFTSVKHHQPLAFGH